MQTAGEIDRMGESGTAFPRCPDPIKRLGEESSVPKETIQPKPRFLKNGSARFLKRFWSHVEINGVDECWPWQCAKTPGGYGRMQVFHIHTTAHRIAFELSNGIEVPEGLQVCHTCDNPPCCNPDHLFWGTGKENQQDCIVKGRRLKGAYNKGMPTHRILDWDAVAAIREITDRLPSRPRMATYEALAAKYGCSVRTIAKVANAENWTEQSAEYFRTAKDRYDEWMNRAHASRKAAPASVVEEDGDF